MTDRFHPPSGHAGLLNVYCSCGYTFYLIFYVQEIMTEKKISYMHKNYLQKYALRRIKQVDLGIKDAFGQVLFFASSASFTGSELCSYHYITKQNISDCQF